MTMRSLGLGNDVLGLGFNGIKGIVLGFFCRGPHYYLMKLNESIHIYTRMWFTWSFESKLLWYCRIVCGILFFRILVGMTSCLIDDSGCVKMCFAKR
jgi:hypothetical protein